MIEGKAFSHTRKPALAEPLLETDEGFAGMDRGKGVDTQRGGCEPAVATIGWRKDPGQFAARDLKIPGGCFF